MREDEDDSYTIVEAKLMARTMKAVMVATKSGNEWIPRSLLHAADDIRADKATLLARFDFRLRTWKAEELDLA
jgi:hypothetical protein